MGPHTFTKKPEALTCYGGGRSFSCHAGPLERRRGDGYIRAEFTQASSKGKELLKDSIDVHMRENMTCMDCHEPDRKSGRHADLKREVNCAKCHDKTVAAHRRGPHRKVDCASCHTSLIGGYAFNFWTLREEGGEKNPVTRLQGYYVDAIAPLLIKNPKGVWIPVHVVPHTSGNVLANEVKLSKRLLFRNRPDSQIERRYFSNDAYAITGLAKKVDEMDHDILVWLNVDRVAHGTGKSRPCKSCHEAPTQRVVVNYEAEGDTYKDVEDGQYTIVADERGLRVVDFKGADGGPMAEGIKPFSDKWTLKGNFALPKIKKRNLYRRVAEDYEKGRFLH